MVPKLRSLDKVGPKKSEPTQNYIMDSATLAHQDEHAKGWEILLAARAEWLAMAKFRRDRERNKRYAYGDQWKDMVCVDGLMMTEEEYIRQQGCMPLKNNLIRRLMRSIMGVWRKQMKEPTCYARDREEKVYGETMSGVLQYNMRLNRMPELYSRSLEEFLISGLVVHRKTYGWRNDKIDCWTDNVPVGNFFVDSRMRDYRGWDVSIIGEFHDISFTTLCANFAKSEADVQRLADIYHTASNTKIWGYGKRDFGYGRENEYMSFHAPGDPTLCRVYEVWRKETRARYRCHDFNTGQGFKIELNEYAQEVVGVNKQRLSDAKSAGMKEEDVPLIEAEWFLDEYWYYYFLAPTGDILQEGETPYAHNSHPYVFKGYPFIDGEIHSLVGDVVDQQRYANRLIMLYDMVIKNSAKNVLFVPEEMLGGRMSYEEIVDAWTRPDGVILGKTRNGGGAPQQIGGSNPGQLGISELLNLQLSLFEDISGVSGALQGKPGFAGMSASLYAQQANNSSTSLVDMLDTFSSFVIECAFKDVKNIQQFYTQTRVINVVGKGAAPLVYDPKQIGDVEFDLDITESTMSPTYRQIANEFLMQIWQSGQITLEQLLQHGDFPFADELLQSLSANAERIKQGEEAEELPPELLAQAQQGADMQSVAAMRQVMQQPSN